jgi:hypothetical protein
VGGIVLTLSAVTIMVRVWTNVVEEVSSQMVKVSVIIALTVATKQDGSLVDTSVISSVNYLTGWALTRTSVSD